MRPMKITCSMFCQPKVHVGRTRARAHEYWLGQRTSREMLITTKARLPDKSLSYLVRPLAISRFLTRRMKAMLSPKSMIRNRHFSIGSQTRLTAESVVRISFTILKVVMGRRKGGWGDILLLMNVSLICSLAGIQMMKTLTLMAVIIAATPHFNLVMISCWSSLVNTLPPAGKSAGGFQHLRDIGTCKEQTYFVAFHLTNISRASRLMII